MGNEIPKRSRQLVETRDRHYCARCMAPTLFGHWHHRRSRSVRDVHRHCPCNGVWLCATCHGWVHAHPFEARSTGFIVSRHEHEPFNVAFLRGDGAWVQPDCSGGAFAWREDAAQSPR